MTAYRNCKNCILAVEPCARKEEVRAAIKGAGITMVKFRCDMREPLYRRGQRVSVTWPVYEDGEMPTDNVWPATVIAESGSRFLLSVDDVESDEGMPAKEFIKNERLFVKVAATRLRALDEPDRLICGWCEKAPAPGANGADCLDISTWGGQGYPPTCLYAQRAAEAS